jgi:serine/threonine protein kinase
MTHPAPQNPTFGRYELLTLLACGGMAEVYLARMTGVGGFERQLVIKRILPHLSGDPDFVEMFMNEGRIAARLAHPNVCHVYELGEVSGDLFLAMEYLDGLSWGELSPLLPRDGRFELRCAAGVIGQVCEGLRYAHELRDAGGDPGIIDYKF